MTVDTKPDPADVVGRYVPDVTARPLRALRVENPLWKAALAKAAEDGSSLSAVVRDLLTEYVGPEMLAEYVRREETT